MARPMAKVLLLEKHLIALEIAQRLETVLPITVKTIAHLRDIGLVDKAGNVTDAGRAIDTGIS